jgi:hypothetical protein
MSFILVPQADRRQTPDRRRFLRGGRRASDVATCEQPLAADDTAAIWTVTGNDQRPPAEKQYFH